MGNYMLVSKDDYLMHYGVKGMKWGHRKNPEVAAARANYRSAKKDWNKSYNKAYNYSARHPVTQYVRKKNKAESDRRWNDAQKKLDTYNKAKSDYKQAKQDYKNSPEGQAAAAKRKKALKVGAAVAGTALAVYGAKKYSDFIKDKGIEVARRNGMEAYDKHISKNKILMGKTVFKDGRIDIEQRSEALGKTTHKYLNERQAKAIEEATRILNRQTEDEALRKNSDIVRKAANANTVQATKNVVSDYVKRKRRGY